MACKESICRNCFHSYVCEQFNENKDDNNEKCHFANDHYIPRADVVPKSEVDDLQDALKCEKETNKHLNDEYIALMKENEKLTINMNVYGLTAKRLAEEKTEVAREIFEEIEKIIASHGITIGLVFDEAEGAAVAIGRIDRKIAELKKKYTEVGE